MALSKCPLEGWIFRAKRAKNETPPPPPYLQDEKSEKWAKVAFEIFHHTQLLCQVSAKSVDHNFWPLEHFLRHFEFFKEHKQLKHRKVYGKITLP